MNERDKIIARLQNAGLSLNMMVGESEQGFQYRLRMIRAELFDLVDEIRRTLRSDAPSHSNNP